MKKLLLAPLVGLLCSHALNAQTAQNEKRTLRFLVVATQPATVTEIRNGELVQVAPPARLQPVSAVELALDGAPKAGGGNGGNTQKNLTQNEIVRVENYKGPSSLRLKLLNQFSQSSREATCELGNLKEPLLVISPSTGREGWEKPEVKVVDLSADKAPVRSVTLLNLTSFPVAAQFESANGITRPGENRLILIPTTPDSQGVVHYRVDAQTTHGVVPVLNTTYGLPDKARLVLVAFTNPQPTPGVIPIAIRTVLETSS